MARLSACTIVFMGNDWLKARQTLLKSVKKDVRARLGKPPRELISYEQEALKGSRGRFRVSSKAALVKEIELADVVYGGDFHAHGSTQRAHLKLLRRISTERPVCLLLECFSVGTQKHLDRYLVGKINAEDLRKRVRWDESWGFSYENYRTLLELARDRGWQVRAIGIAKARSVSRGGLRRQDQVAARSIKKALADFPRPLIYVLIGELHLSHVSELLKQSLKRNLKQKRKSLPPLREVTVQLNTEPVYFRLAKRNLEHGVDVVRYQGTNRYCLLNTPPWVPWQSYLLYLDRTEELRWIDSDGEKFEFDPAEHVRKFALWLAKDLKLISIGQMKEFEQAIEEMNFYSSDNTISWARIETMARGKKRSLAQHLILKDTSFHMPEYGLAYLAQLTINHAAELAGEALQIFLSQRRRSMWDFPGDFYALVFVEALSFFASKQINHKRHAWSVEGLRKSLQSIPSTDEGREALRIALAYRANEIMYFHRGRRLKTVLKPRTSVSYLDAALILGRMAGERLYTVYRMGRLKKKALRALFEIDVTSAEFSKTYIDFVNWLEKEVYSKLNRVRVEEESAREGRWRE